MVAITRALTPIFPVTGRSGRSSPELDANLRTCRAQMADWVTCPSAKTPEGKAKIAQISTRLESIEHQIKKADASPPSAPSPERTPRTGPSGVAAGPVDDPTAPNRLGGNLDVYA